MAHDEVKARADTPEESEAAVEQSYRIGDQQSLVRHAQDGDKDGGSRMGAPEDRDERQDVAQRSAVTRFEIRSVRRRAIIVRH